MAKRQFSLYLCSFFISFVDLLDLFFVNLPYLCRASHVAKPLMPLHLPWHNGRQLILLLKKTK